MSTIFVLHVGEPLIWKTRGLNFWVTLPMKQWPSPQGGPRSDAVTLKTRGVDGHNISKVGLGTSYRLFGSFVGSYSKHQWQNVILRRFTMGRPILTAVR